VPWPDQKPTTLKLNRSAAFLKLFSCFFSSPFASASFNSKKSAVKPFLRSFRPRPVSSRTGFDDVSFFSRFRSYYVRTRLLSTLQRRSSKVQRQQQRHAETPNFSSIGFNQKATIITLISSIAFKNLFVGQSHDFLRKILKLVFNRIKQLLASGRELPLLHE